MQVPRKIFLTAVLIFVSVAVIEVWLANRLVTYGVKLKQIEETVSVLGMENSILRNEIAKKSSLAQIKSYSIALGFGTIQHILYLTPSPSKSLTSNAY